MITKRTLEKWRSEVLIRKELLPKDPKEGATIPIRQYIVDMEIMINMINKLTQELLDQHLMKGK